MPSFRPSRRASKSLSDSTYDELAKPTATEYASEAAKSFLDALEAVAGQIPVPGVAAIVKIAKSIIQACDESHATLERAEELKLRIKKLVTILVDELKEKEAGDIQEKLKQDVSSLLSDLKYVQRKLNDLGSQNTLLLIVFRGLNEDKVKKCLSRLDNSLANFTLVRQINDTKLLDRLERRILGFHSSHQRTLHDVKSGLDDLKVFLKERLPLGPANSSSSQPRRCAAIPANSGIFHGRKLLVDQLVQLLTSNPEGQKRPRICLLGPGGMGKTSTALAVMAHPAMKKHFSEPNQIWVPCVKATSVSLFLDTLYSSVGATQNAGDSLKDVISEIKSFTEPLILLLDNFETPWNVVESRADTQQILYEIDQIAHVTLFITMRSSIPPCNGTQWHSFDIEAIDGTAARQIYLDICPAGTNDADLSMLLESLGYMPLAITLIANMANMTGLPAKKLLEEYNRLGTAMLGQGVGAKHGLDVCISLSVESAPMKRHPGAYDLLARLALLPVGTTYDALVKWWVVRDSPDLLGAMQVLAETSLIRRRETNYFILPVIRSYILHPSRFPSEIRTEMISSACNFLACHNASPGHPSFNEQAAAISSEEGNLQSILIQATDPAPGLIEALRVLAQHQLSTRPRLEVIEHALKLSRQMEDHQLIVGDVLTCYGRILLNVDRFDHAEEKFSLAHQIFLSIPDERRAARCALDLVDAYSFMGGIPFEKQTRLVAEARSVFERLNDAEGVALSLYYLGIITGQNHSRPEAIELLALARKMFHDLGDSGALNHSKCSFFLEQVYYWDKQYDAALIAGTAAVREYDCLSQYPGDPMLALGQILFMQGNYPDALETLDRTLAICKAYGRPIDISQSLEMIGRTLAKMDRALAAQGAYMEATRYYGATKVAEGELGMTRCRFFIRQAVDPALVPTFEERLALCGFHRDF
ncbi:hypothetical protein GALMADRAFT_141056 [Galerina marginata CBS 339.88]|uniref:Novel STAND NTPase 1 domain-containing protein n=1 Tax=Galerina marginata (strain CBS 339.88) TaxID=685588 RepID=A0A067T446_GALM3|nr:hypothetical protein GALMADRAFT_141056 [Galerina marginata CBS 339.88]